MLTQGAEFQEEDPEEFEAEYADEVEENCGRNAIFWWLRSPGGDGYGAACVLFGGGVDTYGVDVNSGSIGVRPAMWMRKEGNNDREKEVD